MKKLTFLMAALSLSLLIAACSDDGTSIIQSTSDISDTASSDITSSDTTTSDADDATTSSDATTSNDTSDTSDVITPIPPGVLSTTPAHFDANVERNAIIYAMFSEEMAPLTINDTTFTLHMGVTPIPATVTYAGVTATLVPLSVLDSNTTFTATITIDAQDLTGVALPAAQTWTFTTSDTLNFGPVPVNLGTAGDYAILAKSAISTTGTTAITGDIALSPSAGSFITGFSLSAPPSTFTTSALITGSVFAADYDAPTPTQLTTAVLDMQSAYTDAAGRSLPDFTELSAGNLSGLTLAPGLYKWGTSVSFSSDVTLSGGSEDIWIFQVSQDLMVGNGAAVTLTGGAQPQHIFWQVAGQATLGTTSSFQGVILCQTNISFNTGAAITGLALAQTAVTLDATTVTHP